jgi:HupE / UreJ protein
MRAKLIAATVMLLSLVVPGFGHRLDEYLQATIISLSKDRVQLSMRLIPGVAVYSTVVRSIDTNQDGLISESEGKAYAHKVLRDLSLSLDGRPLLPELVSVEFPDLGELKEGLGEIHIEFAAALPDGSNNRTLILQNHHQNWISAFLVNCLVPKDRAVRVLAQSRSRDQSFYKLVYAQTGGGEPNLRGTLGNLGGFASMFRLGIRHIAEGTDHLLFLLALLLPAPLLAFHTRWAGFGGLRRSLLQILRVVTAFTVGHSITLALAGLGFVVVPSRPVEMLIAFSILVSAIHGLYPIFPGREPVIAACFGLIHGLAFAATLAQLGLGVWARLGSILAFNLGIETMQLLVVAATLPSLVLLSQTSAYSLLRIGGALFAGVASLGWIVQRLLNLDDSVGVIVDGVARQSVWMAGVLFLMSLVCWHFRETIDERIGAFTALLPDHLASAISQNSAAMVNLVDYDAPTCGGG